MSDPYLKCNKTGNRPHYYCFEDTHTGIYWMIPLSSHIDKYKRIIEKKEKSGKPCDIIHIVNIAGNHQMLTSEHTIKEIEQKARKVMGMLKHGVKFTPTQPDAIAILAKLLS